jgi:hypothetical protein
MKTKASRLHRGAVVDGSPESHAFALPKDQARC